MRRLSIAVIVSAVTLFVTSVARATDQGPAPVNNGGDTGAVLVPPPDASVEAQRQGVPNVLGPTDYVPASPSDELRQDVLRPFQPKEETPAPKPVPVMDDNTA